MDAIRFPAALRGVMESAIQGVLRDHDMQMLPAFAYEEADGELEVCISAVDQPKPEEVIDFDLIRKPYFYRSLHIKDGVRPPNDFQDDERPEAASGAAEEGEDGA